MNYYQQKIIKNLLERKFYFYVAVILTTLITIGSLVPVKNVIVVAQFSDKLLHGFAYFILTLNWLLAYKLKVKELKFLVLILVLVFIYGIIIEVLQGALTSYRQADLYDTLANLGGIVSAWLFFSLIFKRN